MFVTDSAPADAAELTDLAVIRSALAGVVPDPSTWVMAEQLRALRELGSVLAEVEASVTAAFVAARRAEQAAGGVPAARVGQGIPQELGLARRESPNRSGRYAGLASVLIRELPATFAALRAGETTEWRATPLRVDLIITDAALVPSRPGADEPATVSGHGPVPAPWARELVTRTAADTDATVRIRRLFTDPAGRLVTMETNSRDLTPAMAELVKLRDQWCQTPYCGAPIRHTDHHQPWAQGGPTSLANAQWLCEACNYAKQAPTRPRAPEPPPPGSTLERRLRRRLGPRVDYIHRASPVHLV